MKKRLLVGFIITATLILIVPLSLPFLLPDPIYEMLYGWRYPKTWSVGDSIIEDSGPRTANRRYTIELADLKNADSRIVDIQINSLPELEFTIGFDIQSDSTTDPLLDVKPVAATVHLKVVNENGEVVIDEESSLNKWVWSGTVIEKSEAFVYARGKEHEIPLDGGGIRLEREFLRADQGWGTYFVPRKEGHYLVHLEIQESDHNLMLGRFRLVAHGGGWK